MNASDDPSLSRPQYVGARVTRREDPRLLTGDGNYVADIKRHGMVHIAFRRSDHAHARITSLDAEAARTLPGVIAVYTGEDIARLANPYQATSRMKNYQATFIPPVAVDKVRYVGEPVALVVAETPAVAQAALDRIDIDYEPLPFTDNAGDATHYLTFPLFHNEILV